jgi:hypothetical protein
MQSLMSGSPSGNVSPRGPSKKLPGLFVAKAREACGNITQVALAVRLRVDPRTVQNWESKGVEYYCWLAVLRSLRLPPGWQPDAPVPREAADISPPDD